ncbi:flavin reductase family protein [Lentzea sp. NPDC059081]|uniref:flavin reductase family protein n=1 Tax=Lentzea sp. NPDC059081 TaxID=3346719 RepID=UPI003694EB01
MTTVDDAADTGPALRRFMRRWPGGVAVVTSAAGTEPVGCTVSAFLSVSLRPPLVLVSLAEGSRTLAAVERQGRFGVNVLAAAQSDLATRFAAPTCDRFSDVPYHWEHGVPVLEDTVAGAVCLVDRIVAAADHALVLGAVHHCRQDDTTRPVVFFAGSYYGLSP